MTTFLKLTKNFCGSWTSLSKKNVLQLYQIYPDNNKTLPSTLYSRIVVSGPESQFNLSIYLSI